MRPAAHRVLLAMTSPAFAVSKNVEHVKTICRRASGPRRSTSSTTGGQDVMMVTGRFGLKSYSLADPANPQLLDEITSEDSSCRATRRRDFTVPEPGGDPKSTFWQNEDMDVDQDRKLVLISRDPRSYRGSTSREPGEADPNGATNIAGVYVVDASEPGRPEAARVPAAPDRPHDHVHQRLPVAVDRRPGVDHQAEAAAAELDRRPADHRHRPARSGHPVGHTRWSRSTCSAATASPPTRTTSRSTTWASRGSPATAARAATGPTGRTATRSPAQTRAATPLNPIPYGGGGLREARDRRRRRRLRAQRRAAGRPRTRRAPTASGKLPARDRGGLRRSGRSAAASRALQHRARSRAATTARPGVRRPSTSSG